MGRLRDALNRMRFRRHQRRAHKRAAGNAKRKAIMAAANEERNRTLAEMNANLPKGPAPTAAQAWKPNMAAYTLHQTGLTGKTGTNVQLTKVVEVLSAQLSTTTKQMLDMAEAQAKRELEHHDLLGLMQEEARQLIHVSKLLESQDESIADLQNEIDALKMGVVLD